MATSFLTIGGYPDREDYTGDIAWFNTGNKNWNQTLSTFTIDGTSIITEYDMATVMFETGYPYIGLTEEYYDKVTSILNRISGMECTEGNHWGICRAPRSCSELGLN